MGDLLTEFVHTHDHKPLLLFLIIVGLKCQLVGLKKSDGCENVELVVAQHLDFFCECMHTCI